MYDLTTTIMKLKILLLTWSAMSLAMNAQTAGDKAFSVSHGSEEPVPMIPDSYRLQKCFKLQV